MTLVMSTTLSEGSMGWMSVGWVYYDTFPYLGFAIFSLFTGVGSFLGFAETPHFLGSEVELDPSRLPWIACALFMSSTANINAAVWLQAEQPAVWLQTELPATQVQLP